MQSSQIPAKFPIPFANNAAPGYIRTIPVASQISVTGGAASLTDGFPPLNSIQTFSGGIPPFMQDMNGILNEVTKWQQWQGAGGTVQYDAAFSTSIGGYPKGAVLLSALGNSLWVSTTENNTTNPDGGGAGWFAVGDVWSNTTWTAGGSANIQTVTLVPAPTALTQLQGVPLNIYSQGTNTGATTLNVNGLGAKPVVFPNNVSLWSGALATSYPYQVIYTGSVFVMVSFPTPLVHGMQTYATSGAFSFTAPAGVTSVHVKVWGAGGGGGSTNGTAAFGGGGGGGGYAEGFVAVGPGNYAVTVGSFGAASSPGGSSTFANLLTATGGGAGGQQAGSGVAPGGAGGTGTGGSLNVSGSTGGQGYQAGTTLVCALGGGTFGTGFSAPQVTGAGGTANGGSASYPGGGGGGASGLAATGGPGATGLVLVYW